MRRFAWLALISLSMAGGFSAPATAVETSGLYVGLATGFVVPEDTNFKVPGVTGFGGKASLSNGETYALAQGYKFPFGVRLEVEGGYNSLSAKSVDVSGVGSSDLKGHLATWTLLGNAAYDIPLSAHFSWTVGGGAGIGDVTPKFSDATLAGGATVFKAHSAFAWQGLTGLNCSFARDMDLSLEYRLREVMATDHDYEALSGLGSVRLGTKLDHIVMLSVRWYFLPDLWHRS